MTELEEIDAFRRKHARPGMTAGEFVELLPERLHAAYWRSKIRELAAAQQADPDEPVRDHASAEQSRRDALARDIARAWRAIDGDLSEPSSVIEADLRNALSAALDRLTAVYLPDGST